MYIFVQELNRTNIILSYNQQGKLKFCQQHRRQTFVFLHTIYINIPIDLESSSCCGHTSLNRDQESKTDHTHTEHQIAPNLFLKLVRIKIIIIS